MNSPKWWYFAAVRKIVTVVAVHHRVLRSITALTPTLIPRNRRSCMFDDSEGLKYRKNDSTCLWPVRSQTEKADHTVGDATDISQVIRVILFKHSNIFRNNTVYYKNTDY